MAEKVTYVLGAGFSAPLGLPVMSNFLVKSKDLYFSAPESYKHFTSVFDTIENLSVIKNYYKTDLFNIEEILSIIEMENFLEGKRLKRVFCQYIADVVGYYTPEIKSYPGEMPGNWYDFLFGGDSIHEHYCYFVSNLFGLEFRHKEVQDYGEKIRHLNCNQIADRSVKYAVVTLNYDMILEDVCSFICNYYTKTDQIAFRKTDELGDWQNPPLAKLHGSVDIELIIPPTWAKGTNSKITGVWKNAYQVLRESNHIRFIGYSLPIADSYIKYLLKSAVVRAEHLKSIDVICLDPDGSVESRYDDFIEFAYYRFANINAAEYCKTIYSENKRHKPVGGGRQEQLYRLDALEEVHDSFMEQNKSF